MNRSALTRSQLLKMSVAKMATSAISAREDANAFIEHCVEGPGGSRVKQDPCHKQWQRLWSEYQYSVLLAPVGVGKTTALRSYLLRRIAKNPNIQIIYISATERHPKKVVRAMKSEIDRNTRLHSLYPDLRKGGVWRAVEFEVERASKDPDPTVQIFGAFSQSVLGSRSDIVVFDDLCNFGNTLTPHARDRMQEWTGEVISRLKPTAQVIAVGHIFHEFDQLQKWAKTKGWGYIRMEAIVTDEDGNEASLAPGVMSMLDIEKKMTNLGPVLSEMMLFNRIPSKELGRFKSVWIDECLKRGRGLSFKSRWSEGMCYTGVDLGHRKKPGSDLTVAVTVAVLLDGSRLIIDIRSGNWSAPEILRELQLISRQFGSIIAVENNGAQNYLIEFAHELDTIPVRPHATTGVNKHDKQHGVEAMGIEFSQAKWILPCDDKMAPGDEMEMLIAGCMTYDPTSHTADHLMALWIAREAIRLSPSAGGLDPVDVDAFTR